MRIRVRPIRPARHVDEESVDEELTATGRAGPVASDAPVDFGPNEAAVADLLDGAARLSDDQRRRLADAAAWRWWPLTLPPGGASAGARALALLRARGAGRASASAELEPAVRRALGERDAGRQHLVRAVANAALALLARDLIPDESFDALYGPWRDVLHH